LALVSRKYDDVPMLVARQVSARGFDSRKFGMIIIWARRRTNARCRQANDPLMLEVLDQAMRAAAIGRTYAVFLPAAGR
jgi:hypothetical protein